MDDVLNLIDKDVEVMASGIIYRRRVIEITESEVSLQTESGGITIPMERINRISSYHVS